MKKHLTFQKEMKKQRVEQARRSRDNKNRHKGRKKQMRAQESQAIWNWSRGFP
jgi:hypothetical protein